MREIDNIVDFKNYINKLDKMASKVDMTKPNTILPQENDKSVSERLKKFFDVADGNSIWND